MKLTTTQWERRPLCTHLKTLIHHVVAIPAYQWRYYVLSQDEERKHHTRQEKREVPHRSYIPEIGYFPPCATYNRMARRVARPNNPRMAPAVTPIHRPTIRRKRCCYPICHRTRHIYLHEWIRTPRTRGVNLKPQFRTASPQFSNHPVQQNTVQTSSPQFVWNNSQLTHHLSTHWTQRVRHEMESYPPELGSNRFQVRVKR